ncbi:uncharacterized protein LOC111694537 isoform X2 [Trichogramma pretiosum]|uniref:uncharacterized protein LOC111694537 isoform X2 n=1 Tax=Trichogramma pretiosum TaxID=7493 RepID=UPI000C71C99B|nr:uncharacterized protein LOC111694537 isoform X2 [Trichogramma pretiosum]
MKIRNPGNFRSVRKLYVKKRTRPRFKVGRKRLHHARIHFQPSRFNETVESDDDPYLRMEKLLEKQEKNYIEWLRRRGGRFTIQDEIFDTRNKRWRCVNSDKTFKIQAKRHARRKHWYVAPTPLANRWGLVRLRRDRRQDLHLIVGPRRRPKRLMKYNLDNCCTRDIRVERYNLDALKQLVLPAHEEENEKEKNRGRKRKLSEDSHDYPEPSDNLLSPLSKPVLVKEKISTQSEDDSKKVTTNIDSKTEDVSLLEGKMDAEKPDTKSEIKTSDSKTNQSKNTKKVKKSENKIEGVQGSIQGPKQKMKVKITVRYPKISFNRRLKKIRKNLKIKPKKTIQGPKQKMKVKIPVRYPKISFKRRLKIIKKDSKKSKDKIEADNQKANTKNEGKNTGTILKDIIQSYFKKHSKKSEDKTEEDNQKASKKISKDVPQSPDTKINKNVLFSNDTNGRSNRVPETSTKRISLKFPMSPAISAPRTGPHGSFVFPETSSPRQVSTDKQNNESKKTIIPFEKELSLILKDRERLHQIDDYDDNDDDEYYFTSEGRKDEKYAYLDVALRRALDVGKSARKNAYQDQNSSCRKTNDVGKMKEIEDVNRRAELKNEGKNTGTIPKVIIQPDNNRDVKKSEDKTEEVKQKAGKKNEGNNTSTIPKVIIQSDIKKDVKKSEDKTEEVKQKAGKKNEGKNTSTIPKVIIQSENKKDMKKSENKIQGVNQRVETKNEAKKRVLKSLGVRFSDQIESIQRPNTKIEAENNKSKISHVQASHKKDVQRPVTKNAVKFTGTIPKVVNGLGYNEVAKKPDLKIDAKNIVTQNENVSQLKNNKDVKKSENKIVGVKQKAETKNEAEYTGTVSKVFNRLAYNEVVKKSDAKSEVEMIYSRSSDIKSSNKKVVQQPDTQKEVKNTGTIPKVFNRLAYNEVVKKSDAKSEVGISDSKSSDIKCSNEKIVQQPDTQKEVKNTGTIPKVFNRLGYNEVVKKDSKKSEDKTEGVNQKSDPKNEVANKDQRDSGVESNIHKIDRSNLSKKDEKISKDVPKDPAKKISKDVPEGPAKKISKNVPEGSAKKISKDVPESPDTKINKNVSFSNNTNDRSNRVPETSTKRISLKVPMSPAISTPRTGPHGSFVFPETSSPRQVSTDEQNNKSKKTIIQFDKEPSPIVKNHETLHQLDDDSDDDYFKSEGCEVGKDAFLTCSDVENSARKNAHQDQNSNCRKANDLGKNVNSESVAHTNTNNEIVEENVKDFIRAAAKKDQVRQPQVNHQTNHRQIQGGGPNARDNIHQAENGKHLQQIQYNKPNARENIHQANDMNHHHQMKHHGPYAPTHIHQADNRRQFQQIQHTGPHPPENIHQANNMNHHQQMQHNGPYAPQNIHQPNNMNHRQQIKHNGPHPPENIHRAHNINQHQQMQDHGPYAAGNIPQANNMNHHQQMPHHGPLHQQHLNTSNPQQFQMANQHIQGNVYHHLNSSNPQHFQMANPHINGNVQHHLNSNNPQKVLNSSNPQQFQMPNPHIHGNAQQRLHTSNPQQVLNSSNPQRFLNSSNPQQFQMPNPHIHGNAQQHLHTSNPQQVLNSSNPQRFLNSSNHQQFQMPNPHIHGNAQQHLHTSNPQQVLNSSNPQQVLNLSNPQQVLNSSNPQQYQMANPHIHGNAQQHLNSSNPQQVLNSSNPQQVLNSSNPQMIPVVDPNHRGDCQQHLNSSNSQQYQMVDPRTYGNFYYQINPSYSLQVFDPHNPQMYAVGNPHFQGHAQQYPYPGNPVIYYVMAEGTAPSTHRNNENVESPENDRRGNALSAECHPPGEGEHNYDKNDDRSRDSDASEGHYYPQVLSPHLEENHHQEDGGENVSEDFYEREFDETLEGECEEPDYNEGDSYQECERVNEQHENNDGRCDNQRPEEHSYPQDGHEKDEEDGAHCLGYYDLEDDNETPEAYRCQQDDHEGDNNGAQYSEDHYEHPEDEYDADLESSNWDDRCEENPDDIVRAAEPQQQNRAESDGSSQNYVCGLCGAECSSSSVLDMHMKRHSPTTSTKKDETTPPTPRSWSNVLKSSETTTAEPESPAAPVAKQRQQQQRQGGQRPEATSNSTTSNNDSISQPKKSKWRKAFVCTKCHRQFPKLRKFEIHCKHNYLELMHKCEGEGGRVHKYSFRQAHDHYKAAHGGDNIIHDGCNTCVCWVCGRSFESVEEWRQHNQEAHLKTL